MGKRQLTMNKTTLDLTNDSVDILHNSLLSYRPYLLRFNNFNNEQYELRLNKEQLNDLYNFLGDYIKNLE
jgi:hypothetical protein